MDDERIIHSPVSFENERNADKDSQIINWSKNISRNPESLLITDPDYEMTVSQCKYENFVPDAEIRNVVSAASKVSYDQIISCGNDAQEAYSYSLQKGKNKADLEADLIREKRKEKVILTHGFSDYGYTRGKSFYDGSQMYTIIANGRIEDIQRWIISDKEYARILVSDTTSGFIKREGVWTEVFLVSDLENEKFVEQLLSRYFKPSDTRAYKPSALKDFRARIYEGIRSAKLEKVCETTGWNKLGSKNFFFDGRDFPKKNHPLACLRRASFNSVFSMAEVLAGICKELDEIDVGNRLAFLIGYGVTSWFSGVCSIKWNMRPGIMLMGRKSVCKRYADGCLKMYRRLSGSDIVDLAEINKKELVEYVDVLKDDPLVIDCYDITGGTLKLAKAIVSGNSVANHKICAPTVAIQNIPDKELVYEGYVPIDLNGFKVSELLCSNMQALKAFLISAFESDMYKDEEEIGERLVSYEVASRAVFSAIKKFLLSEGVPIAVVDKFFGRLEFGLKMVCNYCGDEKDVLVHLFKQRMEILIITGQISVAGDIEIGVSRDPKRTLIVKGNWVYVPAKYMDEIILPSMNISRSDFRRIRDALISKEILHTYDTDKNYTKRITVSKSERIYAYELSMELFQIIHNNDYKIEGGD